MKFPCRSFLLMTIAACAFLPPASYGASDNLSDILSRMATCQTGDPADWRIDLLEYTRNLPRSQQGCSATASMIIDFMRSDATTVAKHELVPLLQAVVTEAEIPALLELADRDDTGALAMAVLRGAKLVAGADEPRLNLRATGDQIINSPYPGQALLAALRESESGHREDFFRLLYRLPDPDGMGAQILEITNLSNREIEQVLRISSQLGDVSVRDKLREWLSNPPSNTCLLAAVECMAAIGTGEDVPALLKLTEFGAKPIRQEAIIALESMHGTDVDEKLTDCLRLASQQQQTTLMEVLAARKADQATGALLAMATHPDARTRERAIESLSLVAKVEVIYPLIKLRQDCRLPGECKALDQAFYRLLARQPDPGQYLHELQALASEIPPEASPDSLKAIIQRLESEI